MNISTLLKNSAQNFGNRPAISVGKDLKFTYAQMYNRATRLAGGILALKGVHAGDRVILAMSNRPIYLELLFAIWHAGLVVVPINAKLHPQEIAFVAENAEASLCFITDDLAESVTPALSCLTSMKKIINVDTTAYDALFADPVDEAPVNRDDLAWLFYTSGTTGRPKGAMLTHLNLQLMAWSYLCDIDQLTENDAMIHLGPQSHAAGLLALSHIAKASHNILPPSGGFDPAEVASLINIYPNTSFFAAPTMLHRLLDSPEMKQCNIQNIRTIIGGGAPFFSKDIRAALNLFGPRFTNGYGQGECPCTITAMPKHLYSNDLSDENIVTAGIPRTGTEVRVVDSTGTVLPSGEIGEVIIRSDIVMKGYWKNPEATAAALVNGWLHTGDLGTFNDQGFLLLKDRSKDLIISGGSNIYPGELEELLLKHPDVAEVAVVGKPDAEWGETVVAFIVPRKGKTPSTEALDNLCLSHLARFKRPKQYIIIENLPRNNTGKILKTELRQRFSI